MFEPKLLVSDIKCDQENLIMNKIESDKFAKVLISVNPVYNWLEENINNISYRLLKGFITNIIPLGKAGKKYFKKIAHKKVGFTAELWKLYNQLEKIYQRGTLKIMSYYGLCNLNYTGTALGGKCPVDDVMKYLKQQ